MRNKDREMDFDLSALKAADTVCPFYRCHRCLHLRRAKFPKAKAGGFVCPGCGAHHQQPPDWGAVERFLKKNDGVVDFDDFQAHAKKLARGADLVGRPFLDSAFFELVDLFKSARRFVHFASWGMDHQMIGALKVISHDVPVRGIVSNIGPNTRQELMEFPSDAPAMQVRCHPAQDGWAAPHQKLVVIDGLVAITGSANMTVNAWRKVDQSNDLVQVDTNVGRVWDLNNRYFAPKWEGLALDPKGRIVTYKRPASAPPEPDDVPF